MTTEIERLLGVKFDRERKIPGTIPSDTRKYIYIADDGTKRDFKMQFHKITENVSPRNAQYGGMGEEGFRIYLPDGSLFHGISYKGDLEGWRKDIELGAKNLNLPTAVIQDNNIIISDGRSFKLSDCTTEDDYKIQTPEQKNNTEAEREQNSVKQIVLDIQTLKDMAIDLLKNKEQRMALDVIDQFKNGLETSSRTYNDFDIIMEEVLKKNNTKKSKTIQEFLNYIGEMLYIQSSR
jgi:hypothetical protein